MRIAFLTTEFVTEANTDGGLANYLKRTCLMLQSQGHDPVLFVFSDTDEVIDYQGLEVHRVNIRKKPPFWIKWWLKSQSQANGKSQAEYLYPRLLSSWLINEAFKKSHQVNPFDMAQYTNINGIAYYRPASVLAVVRLSSFRRKWLEAYNLQMDDKLKSIVWIEEAALGKVDAIYSPSQLVANLTTEAVNLPVKVIRPPYFMEEYHPDDSWYQNHLKDKKYLLFFGRLGPMKGIYTLGSVLASFLEAHPEYHFVFIGSESGYSGKNHGDYLKDCAASFADRVWVHDKLSKAQLYPVIKNAVGIVLPSLIDNIPNTCLESMFNEKVVLGTRGASFDEMITDGENGLLCEIDNPDSLLIKLNQLLSLSEKEYQQMQKAAKATLKDFSPENSISALLAFYNGVTSK